MTPQTVEDLGKLVRGKYPVYRQAGLSDAELGAKIKAKYPQYGQFADMPPGAEKTGLPSAGKFSPPSPLPQHLLSGAEPKPEENSFLSSPHGMLRSGGREMERGLESFVGGHKAEGVTQMGGGLLEASGPFALGAMGGEASAAALEGRAIEVVSRIALGTASAEATMAAARRLGVPEPLVSAFGVVAGLVGTRGSVDKETLSRIFKEKAGISKIPKAILDIFRKGEGGETSLARGKGTAPPYKYPGPQREGGGSAPKRLARAPQKGKLEPPEGEGETPSSGRPAPKKGGGGGEPSFSPTTSVSEIAKRLKKAKVSKKDWDALPDAKKKEALGFMKWIGGNGREALRSISKELE